MLHLAPERSTGGLGFQKASLEVPPDAWGMDLTFRDSAEVSGVWGVCGGRILRCTQWHGFALEVVVQRPRSLPSDVECLCMWKL